MEKCCCACAVCAVFTKQTNHSTSSKAWRPRTRDDFDWWLPIGVVDDFSSSAKTIFIQKFVCNLLNIHYPFQAHWISVHSIFWISNSVRKVTQTMESKLKHSQIAHIPHNADNTRCNCIHFLRNRSTITSYLCLCARVWAQHICIHYILVSDCYSTQTGILIASNF